MGLSKARKMQKESNTTGSVGNVALAGGYFYIYLGDTLLHIASIPVPNLLGEMNRDKDNIVC